MENSSIAKETFLDRLEFFLISVGLNSNSLTVAAGLSNGLIGKALKNRSSMNSDSIERILCAYTNLSSECFMNGKCTMYKDAQPSKASANTNNLNNENIIYI